VIKELLNRRQRSVLTSDQWHVLHARWVGNARGTARFERSIISEHVDRATAIESAKHFGGSHTPEQGERADEARDQILVRRPDAKSLKFAGRRQPRSA